MPRTFSQKVANLIKGIMVDMNEIRFPRLKFGVDLDPEAGSRPSLWSDQFWTLCHCDNGSKDPGRGHAARILCGILVLWGDTAARHTWGVLGLPTQPFTHMKGWRNPNNPGPMCSYVKLINALLMFLKDSCSTLVHFQIPSKIMFKISTVGPPSANRNSLR